MSAPAEHYDEAERLLARARDCVVVSITRELVAQAHVHAVLATVDPYTVGYEIREDAPGVPDTAPLGVVRDVVTADVVGDRL